MPDGQEIRRVLLEVIEEYSRGSHGSLQASGILQKSSNLLGISSQSNIRDQQALLTLFQDLFRSGHLSWGLNLCNPVSPFCHVTEQGRETLRHLSRDPANPDGYLEYISGMCEINLVSKSYICEAISTYNSGCYKATAVMVGAAAEGCVLELRDTLVTRIESLGKTPSQNLKDWRIKTVLDALRPEIESKKNLMDNKLKEAFEGNWPAFTQQIRKARNDAGHPTSIDPVTQEAVHASLLIFPELAKLASDLRDWIKASYT